MCVPKSSGERTSAPHSSHATANADGIGAAQAGQRWRSSPPHCGHADGSSCSSSRKYRCVWPQLRQNATQSPSVFLRSSWIQLRLGLAMPEL